MLGPGLVLVLVLVLVHSSLLLAWQTSLVLRHFGEGADQWTCATEGLYRLWSGSPVERWQRVAELHPKTVGRTTLQAVRRRAAAAAALLLWAKQRPAQHRRSMPLQVWIFPS